METQKDKALFSKDRWVALFRLVGIDDETMQRWHEGFERESPEAHLSFLEWLGVEAAERDEIRERSRSGRWT